MSIKRKFDLFMLLLTVIFLLSIVISYGATHNLQQKTNELVNLSKELDFLTSLRTTLLNINHNLNIFIKTSTPQTLDAIQRDIEKLKKLVSKTLDFRADEKEFKTIEYIKNNMDKFNEKLNKILYSEDSVERTIAYDTLQVELFDKVLRAIDEHWYEDFEKIYKAQMDSEKAQLIVVHAYSVLIITLLVVFLLIRGVIKRRFIDPILQLSNTSYKMASGELHHRINIQSKDELEDLGKNFNLMAQSLEKNIEDLKKYIQKEQKLIRELSILTEFIGYVVTENDMDTLFHRFVERCRDLLKSDNAAMKVFYNHDCYRFITTNKQIDEQVFESVLRRNETTFEEILSSQDIVNTIIDNPTIINLFKIKYAIYMPLTSSTALRGVVAIYNQERPFTEEDENSLFNFGFQAFQTMSLQNELSRLAKTDGLTGLYNHRMFQERLAEEILRAERYKRTLFLLMIDIDHFKQINDTYGHQAGDMVLKEVAQIIKKSVRQVDFPARYGGEEFALILPEADCENAYKVGERIRQAIQSHDFQIDNGTKINITVSIGIACYPYDTKNKEELIKMADSALYYAKKHGRNRVCLYRHIQL
ncbi:MAG: diguanylate cyclase [Nitrospirae bacterium]|nr:diguanylate cyclase [Nitrospirota bacterium]